MTAAPISSGVSSIGCPLRKTYAHGAAAVAEAAQKACACEEKGEAEEAETWRHVEAALKLMRGPHVS